MAEKHVHWAANVEFNDEDDRDCFVPPTPKQSPPFPQTNTDDDDSLADSPSPVTPPMVLEPMTSNTDTYQARHRSRPMLRPIHAPVHSSADARVTSTDALTLRFGESPPSSDLFTRRELDRSLPSLNPLGPSPRKSSAPALPWHSRRDSVNTPILHPLLAHTSSTNTPALVWDVNDTPSYSTVLMAAPNDRRALIPVPVSVLNLPATNPPQCEMRIHCVGHSLWEPLLVRAVGRPSVPDDDARRPGRATPSVVRGQTPPSPVQYVTVKHVILATFQYLHTRMNSDDYTALGSLPTTGLQKSVARAFYERCDAEERRSTAQQASPDKKVNTFPSRERPGANLSAGNARSGGLRRLDCLLGQTRFRGLDDVEDVSGGWYMCVAGSSR